MRNLLLIGAFSLFSMSSFASPDFGGSEESYAHQKIHVYCDGEYAGYFYNLGYSTPEIVEMAGSMCE